MMECAHCGRLFPEVVGAPTQVCPHCGHETAQAPDAPRAKRVPVDPVGALSEATRIGAREYPRLLLLFLPALILELGVSLAIESYVDAIGLPDDVSVMSTGQQMQLLGVALPLLILLYSVRLALWSFVAAHVLDVALGGHRLARWRAMLAPALLMGFVLTLTFIAGTLLLIVGFLVFLHWFMYAPAELASGAPGVGAAFDRSRRFAREHRTYGFTALVCVLGLVVLVPYFIADSLGGTLGIVVPAAINWIGGPLVPLLAASYVAIARRGAQPGVDVIGPEAAKPRSVTKCPQCGTLIPYTPTGSAIELTCPVCSYKGRVL